MPSCSNPHPHGQHTILRPCGGPGDAVTCLGRPQPPRAPVTLRLDRLLAGRDLADHMVDQLGDLRGVDVTIDARAVASAAPGFVAQLVARLLGPDAAAKMTVLGGPESFTRYARTAADRLGVADRLGSDVGGGADL